MAKEIEEVREDIGDLVLLPMICGAFAAYEWIRYFGHHKPHPWILTVMAAIVAGIAGKKIIEARAYLRNLKLGLEGEIHVGRELDALRSKGFRVLHDLQGDGFNVDHVLIGPKGIYIVETKMKSKTPQSPEMIGYDGTTITIDGQPYMHDPVRQAKAQARWTKELIKSRTGKEFPVRPVVVFPGWWVEKLPHGAEVWVLNPKALPAFIESQQSTLTLADVDWIYAQLSR